MPASVIALSVMTGSDGYQIARQVAEQLQYRYYDWEITNEAATRAGVSPNEVIAAERVPGFVERMVRRLGAVSAGNLETAGVFSEPTTPQWATAVQNLGSDEYRNVIEKVVAELAEQGSAVIVGHAAQYTLRERKGVLKVLIHGSLEPRVERFAREQSLTIQDALPRVKESDKERGELLRRVYHFGWLDPNMYDISINTDHISLDYATQAIVGAAKDLP